LAQHAKTFRLASHFLPRRCRDDAAVLYAWCRLVDDIADESPDATAAQQGLDAVAAELDGTAPARPLVAAFRQVAERSGMPLDAARELIAGVRSDLAPPGKVVRLADDGELLRYCYRVAGTVGLLMCGALGVRDVQRAAPFAIDLGIGMQLTNICRDVLEDSQRGRTYLPADRLRAAGCEPDALTADAVATVVADLLAMADRYYASGTAGMRFIPARPRLAILAAARVYRAIGLRIRRRGCDSVMRGRTMVPRWGKLMRVAGAVARWSGSLVDVRRAPHDALLHEHLRGLPGANAG
ncbi:MAG: phytoene/squalene synthase family protein, partial [Planctomycetota bacterium]